MVQLLYGHTVHNLGQTAYTDIGQHLDNREFDPAFHFDCTLFWGVYHDGSEHTVPVTNNKTMGSTKNLLFSNILYSF